MKINFIIKMICFFSHQNVDFKKQKETDSAKQG